MALTPRRSEIDAVVAILESGDYDDSAAMSREIVKVIAAELQKRDGFGVAIGLPSDDLRLAHGVFYTVLEAKRVVKEANARGLVAFLAPLLSADSALREEEEAMNKRCTCGHPVQLHGSSIKPKAWTTLGCGVYKRNVKCTCGGYDMEK